MSKANIDRDREELVALRQELIEVEQRLGYLTRENMKLKSSKDDLSQLNVQLLLSQIKEIPTSSDMSENEWITNRLAAFNDNTDSQENIKRLLLLVSDLSRMCDEYKTTLLDKEAALKFQAHIIDLGVLQKNRFKGLYYTTIEEVRNANSMRACDMDSSSLGNSRKDEDDARNETELEKKVKDNANKQRTLNIEYDECRRQKLAVDKQNRTLHKEIQLETNNCELKTSLSFQNGPIKTQQKNVIKFKKQHQSVEDRIRQDMASIGQKNCTNSEIKCEEPREHCLNLAGDVFRFTDKSESLCRNTNVKRLLKIARYDNAALRRRLKKVQNIVAQRTAELEESKHAYYATNAKCDQLNKMAAEMEADSKKKHEIFEEYRTKMVTEMSVTRLRLTNAMSRVKEMETVKKERNEHLIQISENDVLLCTLYAECDRLQSALQTMKQNYEMMKPCNEDLNMARDQRQNSNDDLLKSNQEEIVSFSSKLVTKIRELSSAVAQKEEEIKNITEYLAATEAEVISTTKKEANTRKIAESYIDSFAIHTAKIEELENVIAAQPLPDRILPACHTEPIAEIDIPNSLDSIEKCTTCIQAIPIKSERDNPKVVTTEERHDAKFDEDSFQQYEDGYSMEIEESNHQDPENVGFEIHHTQYDDDEVENLNDRNEDAIG